jgi:hypothetical protein
MYFSAEKLAKLWHFTAINNVNNMHVIGFAEYRGKTLACGLDGHNALIVDMTEDLPQVPEYSLWINKETHKKLKDKKAVWAKIVDNNTLHVLDAAENPIHIQAEPAAVYCDFPEFTRFINYYQPTEIQKICFPTLVFEPFSKSIGRREGLHCTFCHDEDGPVFVTATKYPKYIGIVMPFPQDSSWEEGPDTNLLKELTAPEKETCPQ